jgi:hypothetical protein
LGEITCPPAKRIAPAPQPSSPAANAARLSRTLRAANWAARPLRSVPLEAAVALALGTRAVSLAVTCTRSKGTPSSSATICATLVCRPWPISVPPWFTITLPSVYTCTSAPAWLNSVAVKLMPNFTGVIARPRLSTGLCAFHAAIWRRRSR